MTIVILTWCAFFKVLFYSTEIFAAAGVQYSEVATIVVGLTLLTFTVVTVSYININFMTIIMILPYY